MTKALALVLALGSAASCAEVLTAPDHPPEARPRWNATPLTEFAGSQTYQGMTGGLYGDGINTLSPQAAESAMAAARRVMPVSGRYVVLSLGFSNWTQEFCCKATTTSNPAPTSNSFMALAKADPSVRRETQAIINGAMGGQATDSWDSPTDSNYDLVESRLAQRNLTEAQVRVVLFKTADKFPAAGDYLLLASSTGDAIRAMKQRYPNLQMVFLLSRTYGGYATTALNPEPYAYEGGFAVQRVVRAKLTQDSTGAIDSLVGDLSGVWVGWGPYLWADGVVPRADGLTWLRSDFVTDGVHPSPSGVSKVAGQLLGFLKQTPHAACWFITTAGAC